MMTFVIPAICVIVIFWISVGITYLMLRSQLLPIIRSIKRLDRQLGGRPSTEEFVTSTQPRPRPSLPSRYVTVDREWK